jgi:hypothetical protein
MLPQVGVAIFRRQFQRRFSRVTQLGGNEQGNERQKHT